MFLYYIAYVTCTIEKEHSDALICIANYSSLDYFTYPYSLLTPVSFTAFLAGGIYAQSIQSAQIEFSALNAINTLYMKYFYLMS